ncbi:MAG: OmpA family protein [bacterium]|nr:OmpA family protein [bacterium]
MFGRWARFFIVLVIVAASCSGGDAADTSVATSPTTTTSTSTAPATSTTVTTTAPPQTTSSTATTTTTTTTQPPPPEDVEREDWLTIAGGVTLVSFEGDRTSASVGVRAIDGEPTQIGFAVDTSEPSVYVFELPAATTFDRFAVPDTRNSPGNTTFVGNIEIAGSNTGATEDFEVLVAEDFAELPEDEDVAEFVPAIQTPVRWIRLTVSGALHVEPEHDPGRTTVRFTELIGNGIQEAVPLSEDFNGVWELAFADNPDGHGEPTELHQDGARVAGCVGFAAVTGTVAGNVVRLNGIDTRDQRASAYLFVVNPDGRLRGMESTNNGVFRARIGRVAPDGTTTDCSEVTPEPLACGSVAYINFDVNSADIRPDSEQVLDDLFDGLSEISGRAVMIEGHTSTEGATDYNLDLSERRAQAVVDALVARGLSDELISAVGKGESEPLVSESDETSRAINRRVEIDCG